MADVSYPVIDKLLAGQVEIVQADDYRVAVDSVLLANFVASHYYGGQSPYMQASQQNNMPQKIAELGVGTGGVMLCLLHYIAQYHKQEMPCYDGYDCNGHFLSLAKQSLSLNKMDANLHETDIRDIERRGCYDAVVMNPPFLPFSEHAGMKRSDMRSRALYEGEVSLHDWLRIAGKLLTHHGWLFMVHQAERLHEIIAILQQKFGGIILYPIHSYAGQAAKRILIATQYGSKTKTTLQSGLVMHQADGRYTLLAEQILRAEILCGTR